MVAIEGKNYLKKKAYPSPMKPLNSSPLGKNYSLKFINH